MTRTLLLTALLAILPSFAFASDDALTTLSERGGFVRTGRYDEVIALCDAFARRYPDAVRCADFGTTPEGRPMKVLIASRTGALTPEAAKAKGLPVLLIQGGIHAGEIDGKDAGFLALRQVLDGKAAPGALDKLVLVFVPVFNVDGHERFGPLEPPQPARPRGNGLAHHRAEPQPQPRLREGRRARDAGDAAPARRVGPAGLHRPARHRRRQVRARRLDPGRAGQQRRRVPARGRQGAARRRDRTPGRAGLAAAAVLPLVRGRRRPVVGIRGRRRHAALLAGLLPAAQSSRHAGGDAFLARLPASGQRSPATPSSPCSN